MYGHTPSMGSETTPMGIAFKYLRDTEFEIDVRWVETIRKGVRMDTAAFLNDKDVEASQWTHRWLKEQMQHIQSKFRDYADAVARQTNGCMDLANHSLTDVLAIPRRPGDPEWSLGASTSDPAVREATRAMFAQGIHFGLMRSHSTTIGIPAMLGDFRDACVGLDGVLTEAGKMSWNASSSEKPIRQWLNAMSGAHSAMSCLALVAVGAWSGVITAFATEGRINYKLMPTGDLLQDAKVYVNMHSIVSDILTETSAPVSPSPTGANNPNNNIIEHPITRSFSALDDTSKRRLAEDLWMAASGWYGPHGRLAPAVITKVWQMLLRNFSTFVPLRPTFVSRLVDRDSCEYVRYSPNEEVQFASKVRDSMCHLMLADRTGKRLMNLMTARALVLMYGIHHNHNHHNPNRSHNASNANSTPGTPRQGTDPAESDREKEKEKGKEKERESDTDERDRSLSSFSSHSKAAGSRSYTQAVLYLLCDQLGVPHDVSLLRPEMHAELSGYWEPISGTTTPMLSILCTRPLWEPLEIPPTVYAPDSRRLIKNRSREATLLLILIRDLSAVRTAADLQSLIQIVLCGPVRSSTSAIVSPTPVAASTSSQLNGLIGSGGGGSVGVSGGADTSTTTGSMNGGGTGPSARGPMLNEADIARLMQGSWGGAQTHPRTMLANTGGTGNAINTTELMSVNIAVAFSDLPPIDDWFLQAGLSKGPMGTAYAEGVPVRLLLLAHALLYVADRMECMLEGPLHTQIGAESKNSQFARICLWLQYTQTHAVKDPQFGTAVAKMATPASLHSAERVWFALFLIHRLYGRTDKRNGCTSLDYSEIIKDFRNIKIVVPRVWGSNVWIALPE